MAVTFLLSFAELFGMLLFHKKASEHAVGEQKFMLVKAGK